jgi:2-polyprenyl-3-methyl-5-hydroxy-6-metoxy-1,4-benzoquinol methylase
VEQISNLDKIADDYHNNQPVDIWIENKIQQYEFPWIKNQIKSGMKILDLGIGDGIVLDLLINLAKDIKYSLDVLEGSKNICVKYIDFQTENLRILNEYFEDFKSDHKYDLIIMSHILEHVVEPKEILFKYKEFLKPNGKIIGIVPNMHSLHRRLAVKMGLQDELDTLSSRDKIVGHLRVYSVAKLNEDIEKSDLEVISFKGFFLKPLANFQLLQFEQHLIDALLEVSDEVPIELTANIGFIASPKGS